MMRFCLKTSLFVLLVAACAGASVNFNVTRVLGKSNLSDQALAGMINNALNLDNGQVVYNSALVKLYNDAAAGQEYAVVFLYQPDSYLVTVFRLNIRESKVVSVIPDYVEDDPAGREVCSTCPDPEVQVVIAYLDNPSYPGAKTHGVKAFVTCTTAHVKSVLLVGAKENKQTIKNYLACPKFKVWGRIGHGNTSMIQLCDGSSFTTSDINSLAANIKGRSFVFNSCLCHNSPFEPAMMNAGAYFYAAGDISLSGGKEGVFSAWVKKVVAENKALDLAMDEATTENNYPRAWGYSGKGTKPWKIDFSGTSISLAGNAPKPLGVFTVRVMPGQVYFSTGCDISIYNIFGQLMYRVAPENCGVWNMTSVSGQQVSSGTYTALYSNGTNAGAKTFTILK